VIIKKSPAEIESMARAGEVLVEALELLAAEIRRG
jgi:Xaa-Pro aminopeptidase